MGVSKAATALYTILESGKQLAEWLAETTQEGLLHILHTYEVTNWKIYSN